MKWKPAVEGKDGLAVLPDRSPTDGRFGWQPKRPEAIHRRPQKECAQTSTYSKRVSVSAIA